MKHEQICEKFKDYMKKELDRVLISKDENMTKDVDDILEVNSYVTKALDVYKDKRREVEL